MEAEHNDNSDDNSGSEVFEVAIDGIIPTESKNKEEDENKEVLLPMPQTEPAGNDNTPATKATNTSRSNTLPGAKRKIWQAMTKQGIIQKPCQERKQKKVNWSDKIKSNKEEMDNSAIKIDDSKTYTPINQNVGPAERRVYKLWSRNKNNNEDSSFNMDQEDFNNVVHYALTQYSLKQGLKFLKMKGNTP
eukprot:6638010-Ditylum_brightwellii.AAC.1